MDLKATDDFNDLMRNNEEDVTEEVAEDEAVIDFALLKVDVGKGHLKSHKNNEFMTIQCVLKEYVLSFLPAKALHRLKSVSKDWNHWISSPFLAHQQSCKFRKMSGLFCQSTENIFFVSLDRSSCGIPSQSLDFLPETVTIRASSNGLLCCSSRFPDRANRFNYYICNPANREWISLPAPMYYHGEGTAVALDFEPSLLNFAAQFKLVCAVPLVGSPGFVFETYSSQADSWCVSETVCYDLEARRLNDDGFFFNGAAYWKANSRSVLVFDPNNEQYGVLPLPLGNGDQGTLTAMSGELCYIEPEKEKDGDEFVIEVYGDFDMRLKHKIPLDLEALLPIRGREVALRALPCVNDDVLMLLVGEKLCAYHVGKGKLEVVSNNVTTSGHSKFFPYVNSIVSLNLTLVLGVETVSWVV